MKSNFGNSRAAVTPIDASNVTGLEVAWTVELDGGASTAPLIVGDIAIVGSESMRVLKESGIRATGDFIKTLSG